MNIKNNETFTILKKGMFPFLIKIAGMIFTYSAMLIVTKNYGAKIWGEYSLSMTILSISILLPKFGFDISLVKIISNLNINKDNNKIINVIIKSLIIATLISLIVSLSLNYFTNFLVRVSNNEDIRHSILIISISVPLMVSLTIISTTFQALKKTSLFIVFQTSLINFIFLLILTLYHFNGGDIKVFKIYFISIIIATVIAFIFLINYFKYDIKHYISLTKKKFLSFKDIIKESTPMLFSNSIVLLMSWTDILMLSHYKTTTDIGIYDTTLKLALLSSITLIAINAIVAPKFVELYSNNDIKGLEKTVQSSTKLIFYTSTPILLILILFSKSILNLMGEEFVIGYLSLIFLSFSRFINAICGSVGYIMQMTNLQNIYKNILIIALIINIILNYFLIPKYSFTGAALASSITMIFWNIAMVIVVKKKLGFWTTLTFNTN